MNVRKQNYYLKGFLTGLPFLLVIIPFGILFGVVATEAGLNAIQTMAMTVLVIAGAAQFAAIQLMIEQSPLIVIILTGLAVNMRMAMYSASIATHIGAAPTWQKIIAAYFLIDQSYAASIRQYEDTPKMNVSEKMSFFFGTITPICITWYASTYVGIIAGTSIPPEYALDFAVPITFLSLVGPSLRSIPHLAAAIVSVFVSLMLSDLPYNLWLIIAAILAMMTGAYLEKRLEITP